MLEWWIRFSDHLEVILKHPPEWDKEKKYTIKTIQVTDDDVMCSQVLVGTF